MKKRNLGNSELEVSPLAFGGNVFGWTVDEPSAFILLDQLIAAGGNFIDTADVYSRWVPGNKGGESETIIGNWLKSRGKRKEVIIATKVGMEMSATKTGLSKKYIFQAVEDSLQRLQTDYIDLYQSHCDDTNTPLEETLDAYAELIKQGKVRTIGASNFTVSRLAEALQLSKKFGYPPYQSVQPEYNLYDREDYEKNLEQFCLDNNLGVICYYSLASGFLSGKYRSTKDLSQSPRGQGVQKYLTDRGFRILDALDKAAKEYNATPTQIALAWLMARPSITAPIASATNPTQLNDLIAATKLELSKATIAELEKL